MSVRLSSIVSQRSINPRHQVRPLRHANILCVRHVPVRSCNDKSESWAEALREYQSVVKLYVEISVADAIAGESGEIVTLGDIRLPVASISGRCHVRDVCCRRGGQVDQRVLR